LQIESKDRCHGDLVGLGEVMLRLDPGDVRAAHCALAMAALGGTAMASLSEVEKAMKGSSVRVAR
jgi:hypothetical protein